jgi:hypothetical protein
MESVLAPQVMLYGFLGFQPQLDGFTLHPRLPRDWPELAISRIHYHRQILDVRVSAGEIRIASTGGYRGPVTCFLPRGNWQLRYPDTEDREIGQPVLFSSAGDQTDVPLDFTTTPVAELTLVP